jgi:hypothetical protein
MPGTSSTVNQDDAPMENPQTTQAEAGLTQAQFYGHLLQNSTDSGQQQENLMNHIISETNRARATPVTPTTPAVPVTPIAKGIKPKPPMVFNGDSKKFKDFMTQLYLVFNSSPEKYASTDARVYYALSYMQEGKAQTWVRNFVDDVVNGRKNWISWGEFEQEMREHFDSQNKKDDAQLALRHMQQGFQSAEEFFDNFKTFSSDCGYNDEALVRCIKDALTPRLLSAIYSQNVVPKTYTEWKNIAIQKDRQWRESNTNLHAGSGRFSGGGATGRGDGGGRGGWRGGWRGRWQGGSRQGGGHGGQFNVGGGQYGGGRGSGTGSGQYGSGGGGGGQNGGGGVTHAGPSQTGTFGGTGIPMEIDKARGGNFGRAHCYICGGEGHFARNCTKAVPKPGCQQVRSMFDAMDDSERKQLIEEMGF